MDVPEICRICSARADGTHFQVISCRACAAFFRRTISLRLTYQCRSNEGCLIEKQQRNMCRACRFAKCIQYGMRDLDVQLLRDPIGKKKNGFQSTETKQSKFPTSPHPSPTTSNVIVTNPSFQTLSDRVCGGFTLSKMVEGYTHFLLIRKATHTLLENDKNIKIFKRDPENLHFSNFDASKKVCQLEAHLITDIVNTYFPPFNNLCYEDKITLFKNFFCFFSHTDRAYQSYKKFGNDKSNDKMLMPDGGYIKRSELGKFYENAKGVHGSPEDAARVFSPVLDYILNVIIDHMRRIEMHETEYVALLGFCLWDNSVSGITEAAKEVVYKTQKTIIADLQLFYESRDIQKDDIPNRIGQLMLLIPRLTKCVIMLQESSVVAELFNLYEPDVCCKNSKSEGVTSDCSSSQNSEIDVVAD
ncbi:unnamed protein product [Caenorhabditis auriculariae]|uniref:Uncharacterized protein n=1 Tax=Caenorhabditis auriculariae TaxID=2777116 RepID=A0A8S1GPL7_9PELO|nr:unnamed protein product [Caenorhabditis auriculariae]